MTDPAYMNTDTAKGPDLAEMRRSLRSLRRWLGPVQEPLELPELAEVAPPPILPGEPWPQPLADPPAFDADMPWLVGPGVYYGPEGEPLQGHIAEVMHRIDYVRTGPGGHLLSRPMFRAGTRIRVSTIYLGINGALSWDDSLPKAWETMVFTGEGHGVGGECWRYTTTAAAHAGHHQVVETIRDEQRRRREDTVLLPPRRNGRWR